MKEFQITEVAFDPADTVPTLEDEFTMETVSREIESINDPKKLKLAAIKLLMITMQRQAIIRGLCKQLANGKTSDIVTKSHNNQLLNSVKQHKKLIKLATKAENCTSRDQAQKIIKKAEKTQLKLSADLFDLDQV